MKGSFKKYNSNYIFWGSGFKPPIILIALVLFFSETCFSQKRANNWVFGYNNGVRLDFNTLGDPVQSLGNLSCYEGTISMSDTAGNLLFTTFGRNVINRLNATMLNGYNITGSTYVSDCATSSTQCIAVPLPGSDVLYYLFTLETTDPFCNSMDGGLYYSIVDMTLNGGLGDVSIKGVQVTQQSAEKVTAVRHANGTDYWIITHDFNGNTWRCFLLSNSGLSANPVVSATGLEIHGNLEPAGQIKANIAGNRLLAAHVTRGIEVLEFDNSTGQLSNSIILRTDSTHEYYGAEFSPSGRFAYFTSITDTVENNLTEIFQYDLYAGSASDIIESEFVVKSNLPSLKPIKFAALQLAPNGRIYCATIGKYLAEIKFPNRKGLSCKYRDSLVLDPAYPQSILLGLPGFPNDFFVDRSLPVIQPDFDCFALGSIQFSVENLQHYDSLYWNFGDPTSLFNTSIETNPGHQYLNEGEFLVRLVIFNAGDSIVLTRSLYINLNQLDIGNDTLICPGDSITLTASQGFSSYLWNNGSTAMSVTADTGTYTCTAWGNNQFNLIYNGSFDIPSSLTDYTIYDEFFFDYVVGAPISAGKLFLTSNPNSINLTYSACFDHSTGDGNMLLVSGDGFARDIPFYGNTVDVTPNTDYLLTFWTQKVRQISPNNLKIEVQLNDDSIAAVLVGTSLCGWQKHEINWNSGNNSSVSIELVSLNPNAGNTNIFAVDDISFSPVCVQSQTVTVAPSFSGSIEILGLNDKLCTEDGLVVLTGDPSGGYFSGEGLTNNIFNPYAAGVGNHTITYSFTDSFGCFYSDGVDVEVRKCVTQGFDKNELTMFHVFPNPSDGTFNTTSLISGYDISVYNSVGQIVFERQNLEEKKLIFDQFSSGIYFLKFSFNNTSVALTFNKVL